MNIEPKQITLKNFLDIFTFTADPEAGKITLPDTAFFQTAAILKMLEELSLKLEQLRGAIR